MSLSTENETDNPLPQPPTDNLVPQTVTSADLKMEPGMTTGIGLWVHVCLHFFIRQRSDVFFLSVFTIYNKFHDGPCL